MLLPFSAFRSVALLTAEDARSNTHLTINLTASSITISPANKERGANEMVTTSKRTGPKWLIPLGAVSLALSLAVMLGLAAPALVPPARASAHTSSADTISRLHAGGEPQLHVSKPAAAKPDGAKQPIDLSVKLIDESGNPIEGAKVMARATDFETFVDAPLTDMGNGRYSACAFGYFNGSGEGAVRIHVRADKPGYTSGAGDGSNYVGRLCAVSGTGPSR